MEPIFDREGGLSGWLYKKDFVLDASGHCRAFVDSGTVLSHDGEQLGHFHNGYFWASDGGAVGCVRWGFGGPAKPEMRLQPLPPLPRVPWVKPRTAPSTRLVFSDEWSESSFDCFLSVEQSTEDRETAGAGSSAPP